MSLEGRQFADAHNTDRFEDSQQKLSIQIQGMEQTGYFPTNRRRVEADPDSLDCNTGNIFGDKRAVSQVQHGRNSFDGAEDQIRSSLQQLVDGCGNEKHVAQQLQGTVRQLDNGISQVREGVRDMDRDTLDRDAAHDVRSGRRQVDDGRDHIENAIKRLNRGDENGAIGELIKGLRSIDKGEGNIDDGIKEFERDIHRREQVQHHYHRPTLLDLAGDGDFEEAHQAKDIFRGRGGDFFTHGHGGDFFNDYRVTIQPVRDDRYASAGYSPMNFFPSASDLVGPRIDIAQSLQDLDGVSHFVDPAGFFPRPSEVTKPEKVIKRALLGPLADIL